MKETKKKLVYSVPCVFNRNAVMNNINDCRRNNAKLVAEIRKREATKKQ